MEAILEFLTTPFVLLIIGIGGAVFARRRFKIYLSIARLLIDAIELIDDNIKDIVSPENRTKITKIKKWINGRLSKNEKKAVNGILFDKGYLKKKKEG